MTERDQWSGWKVEEHPTHLIVTAPGGGQVALACYEYFDPAEKLVKTAVAVSETPESLRRINCVTNCMYEQLARFKGPSGAYAYAARALGIEVMDGPKIEGAMIEIAGTIRFEDDNAASQAKMQENTSRTGLGRLADFENTPKARAQVIAALLSQYGPLSTREITERVSYPASAEELCEMSALSRTSGFGFRHGKWALAQDSDAVRKAISQDTITDEQAELVRDALADSVEIIPDPLRPLTGDELKVLSKCRGGRLVNFGDPLPAQGIALVRMGLIIPVMTAPGRFAYRIASRGRKVLSSRIWDPDGSGVGSS